MTIHLSAFASRFVVFPFSFYIFLFISFSLRSKHRIYAQGSLCFMANCFIIFDIFPVYYHGPPFCFMAVYCVWWTPLYVPPSTAYTRLTHLHLTLKMKLKEKYWVVLWKLSIRNITIVSFKICYFFDPYGAIFGKLILAPQTHNWDCPGSLL